MTDPLRALLEAERAVAHAVDDDAFAGRVVGHLREVAAAVPAATTALTTTTATATTTATTGVKAGIAKLVAAVVVSGTVVTGVVVTQQRAAVPEPIAVSAPPIIVVEPIPPAPLSVPVERQEPLPPAHDEAPVVTQPEAARSSSSIATRPAPVLIDTAPAPIAAPPPATELDDYDRGVVALRAGQVDVAAAIFAGVLRTYPRGMLRPETWLSLLESHYRGGRFAEVVKGAADAAADVDADASGVRAADIQRLRADALVRLARCDEAGVAYAAALAGRARQLTADDVTAALAACLR